MRTGTTTSGEGKSSGGRPAKVNSAALMNPAAQRVAELRAALLGRIGSRDIQQIVGKLVSKAKAGDIAAAREVLDRSIGKAKQSVELEATAHTEQDEQKPLDHWGRMREAFNFYIMFMVPKRAWMPGYLLQYEAWQEGNGNGHRPADWDQITQQVEARCNWIRMTPEAAKDWRTRCMVYDGQALKTDGSKYPIAGVEDDQQA